MPSPSSPISFSAALDLVRAHAERLQASRPSRPETVPLLAARGRVLAAPVFADRDQPAFDRATRDGFAVQAGYAATARPAKMLGLLRAGQRWGGPVPEGSAVQIMTGAPMPAGTDSVAMVEHVEFDGDTVRLVSGRSLAAGENVVPRGSEARAGTSVVPQGTRVGAAEIAIAATCGAATLSVWPRLPVAIVATGDELVEFDQAPGPDQIRNSNGYALSALAEAAGAIPHRQPPAPDTREAIAAALVQARAQIGNSPGLLLFSGGVSMGEYDLVEEVLAAAGAEFLFTGVQMQPGKPLVFGRLPARGSQPELLFFGLPGNPVSTQVTFQCFAEPLLRALEGEAFPGPRWSLATLTADVAPRDGLTRILPARLSGTEVRLVTWQGSGDQAANARANCYAELLPGHAYRAGDTLRVLLR